MNQIQLQSESEQQTLSVAKALATSIQPGDVIALEGELGAGKTVFVRGLAEGLGISPSLVSSPTFVIRQEYTGKGAESPQLVHIDSYRLGGVDDLESIGWNELLAEKNAIVAVEWPSRIHPALPPNRIDVEIDHAGTQSRAIIISVPEELADRLHGLTKMDLTAAQCAREVKCPKCGSKVSGSSPTFPFCSKRCKMADLGAWFSEKYRTSRPAQADEDFED